MNIFDRFLQRIGYTKAVGKQPVYPQMILADAAGAYMDWPTSYGYEESAKMFTRLSWVNTAISIFAQTAAITPLNVLEMVREEDQDISNHPFEQLLLKPNPNQSRFEFLEATFAFYRMGDAYWWINQPDGMTTPGEIWVIPPNRIRPVDGGNLLIDGYIYTDSLGRDWPIPVDRIVHFKSFNPLNEFVGSQKLEALTLVAKSDLAQQAWNHNLFGRDNAKLPGALAFRDMVPPTDWENLKKDIKGQWGGTNRGGPLLLRGTGAGGVEWVSMAATPQEMEFIASRNFTKEEIYGVLAPGAASILAVNATEANALTGKQTLIDLAIWPSMVSISQKITNDLLPAYGQNLKAEFDDIRVTDRVLELQEQAEYSKTHTVKEVRQKYYNDDPLNDDRDNLFPAQVTGTTGALPVTQELQPLQSNLLTALNKWQQKAEKRYKDKGSADCDFTDDAIPGGLAGAIMGALAAVKSMDGIKRVFADARQWQATKESHNNDFTLSYELKRANDLLESFR